MTQAGARGPSVSLRRWLAGFAIGLLLALWAVWLRPTWLGGAAAYVVVAGESMLPTLTDGTLVLTQTRPEYEIGDVVAFAVDAGSPLGRPLVIHRIVAGSAEAGFTTRGDNRPHSDPWIVRTDDIVGRQAYALPGVGQFLTWLRSPIVLASLGAGLAAYVVLGWSGNSGRSSSSARCRRAGTRGP